MKKDIAEAAKSNVEPTKNADGNSTGMTEEEIIKGLNDREKESGIPITIRGTGVADLSEMPADAAYVMRFAPKDLIPKISTPVDPRWPNRNISYSSFRLLELYSGLKLNEVESITVGVPARGMKEFNDGDAFRSLRFPFAACIKTSVPIPKDRIIAWTGARRDRKSRDRYLAGGSRFYFKDPRTLIVLNDIYGKRGPTGLPQMTQTDHFQEILDRKYASNKHNWLISAIPGEFYHRTTCNYPGGEKVECLREFIKGGKTIATESMDADPPISGISALLRGGEMGDVVFRAKELTATDDPELHELAVKIITSQDMTDPTLDLLFELLLKEGKGGFAAAGKFYDCLRSMKLGYYKKSNRSERSWEISRFQKNQ